MTHAERLYGRASTDDVVQSVRRLRAERDQLRLRDRDHARSMHQVPQASYAVHAPLCMLRCVLIAMLCMLRWAVVAMLCMLRRAVIAMLCCDCGASCTALRCADAVLC